MRTELFWVDGPWTGRIAVAPRPRGGDWLEDEAANWRKAGVDAVVSLLTEQEEQDLELTDEKVRIESGGMRFLAFPIEDYGIPESVAASRALAEEIGELAAGGKKVLIHCRQGIGRAGMIASAVLILAGVGDDEAVRRVTAARGRAVPETPEQRRWVADFARITSRGSP
jgi:protein-tyrosine phosphatase